MKKIHTYILEKLKINKDIKVEFNKKEEILDTILKICCIDKSLKVEQEIISEINVWINKYNITNFDDIRCVSNYQQLKYLGIFKYLKSLHLIDLIEDNFKYVAGTTSYLNKDDIFAEINNDVVHNYLMVDRKIILYHYEEKNNSKYNYEILFEYTK